MRPNKLSCVPGCYLAGIGTGCRTAHPQLGAPRLIAHARQKLPVMHKARRLGNPDCADQLSLCRYSRHMTNQNISQRHSAGGRLSYRSSARSSSSGDGRDGSTEGGVQTCEFLDKQPRPEIGEGMGDTYKIFASRSDYTCVMNGGAGRGVALLGNPGCL